MACRARFLRLLTLAQVALPSAAGSLAASRGKTSVARVPFMGSLSRKVDAKAGFGAWLREVVMEASERTGDEAPAWARAAMEAPAATPAPTEPAPAVEGEAPAASQDAGCRASARPPSPAGSWLAMLAPLMLLAHRARKSRRSQGA